MSKNGQTDTKDENGAQSSAPNPQEAGQSGHSGEGAASAMAHLISQGQQHRHPTGEADDAAGSRHA
jgi:hypothetical protein